MEAIKVGREWFSDVFNDYLLFITSKKISIRTSNDFKVRKEILDKGSIQFDILVVDSNRFIYEQLRNGKVYFTMYNLDNNERIVWCISDDYALYSFLNETKSSLVVVGANKVHVWDFNINHVDKYHYDLSERPFIISSSSWNRNSIILNITNNEEGTRVYSLIFDETSRSFRKIEGKFSSSDYDIFISKKYHIDLNIYSFSNVHTLQLYNAKEEKILELYDASVDFIDMGAKEIINDKEYFIFFGYNGICTYSKNEKKAKIYKENKVHPKIGIYGSKFIYRLGYIQSERKVIVTTDKVRTIHVDELYNTSREIESIFVSLP